MFAIVVPMLIGSSVYLLFDRNIIIFDKIGFSSGQYVFFSSVFNCKPAFLRNYLCDFCWSFSLECAVYLFLVKNKKNLIISVIVSSSVSVIIEFLQVLKVISGTFDIFDIILEIIAVIAAGFILNKIWEDKT